MVQAVNTQYQHQNQKPTIQDLIKKHFGDFELSYDGMEFDGSKVIGKHTKTILPKHAFAFLKEVNQFYPFSIKETTVIEPLKKDEDTNVYLERYFLGQGFRLYID